MDLLFKRYASPFLLLDELILSQDFSEFIDTVLDVTEDEKRWDYYLSRIFDKSYNEFIQDMTAIKPDEDIETTIAEAMKIVTNFAPNKTGG